MADPVISPDGKWMWTGAEWISAPPGTEAKVNLQDSMMSGDVNIQQSSPNASSVVNLKDSAMTGDIVINDEQTIKNSFKEIITEVNPVCSKCRSPSRELLVCCNLNCRVPFCIECGLRNVDNELILYAPNFRGGGISDFLQSTHIYFGELFGYYNGTEIFNESIYTGSNKILSQKCNGNLIPYLLYRFCKSKRSFDENFVGSKGPYCEECMEKEFVDFFNYSGWKVDNQGTLINPRLNNS